MKTVRDRLSVNDVEAARLRREKAHANRQRLSVSVDAELAQAAAAAVEQGDAPTLSAWVNDALRLKLVQEQRLRALAAFVAAYEERHGVISPDEIVKATRRARARAVSVPTPIDAKASRPARARRGAR